MDGPGPLVFIFIIAVAHVLGMVFGYEMGYSSGRLKANIEATKIVCTRNVNAAPKQWCEETLVKEIYDNK